MQTDEEALSRLQEAGALYERYLELTRLNELPTVAEQADEERPSPAHTWGNPLGLQIRTAS